MLRVRIRADVKCSRHPRFNPDNGMGAVKGGCLVCMELCAIREGALRLERQIRNAQNYDALHNRPDRAVITAAHQGRTAPANAAEVP